MNTRNKCKASAPARRALVRYRAARAAFLALMAPIIADVAAGRRSPENRRAVGRIYMADSGLFFARLDLECHREKGVSL